MNLTVADLAKQLAADVSGDASATLTGFAMIDRAKAGDLTFAETPEYFAAADEVRRRTRGRGQKPASRDTA